MFGGVNIGKNTDLSILLKIIKEKQSQKNIWNIYNFIFLLS